MFLAKITTMYYNVLKFLNRTSVNLFFLEVACDNVVSNDVTITSALPSDRMIFGINFLLFSKLIYHNGIYMSQNYETVKICFTQRKLLAIFLDTVLINEINS